MNGRGVARHVAGAVALSSAVVLIVRDGVDRDFLALVTAAVLLVVAVATIWTAARIGGEPVEDERHSRPALPCACGEIGRRRVLLFGAGGAGLVAAAGGLGWLLSTSRHAERMLTRTAWRAGVPVVDGRGRRVSASSLSPGTVTTVWPEGHLDEDDAQAVLIHLRSGQGVSAPGRDDWTVGGFVAYSKLCTHMGCPVGLYQERANVLVCPCHQAAFDVLRGARPVLGPARRPLPQLPLLIDEEEGVLTAGGDFSGPVGSSFWASPR